MDVSTKLRFTIIVLLMAVICCKGDLIPRDALINSVDHGDVQISPCGRYITWIGQNKDRFTLYLGVSVAPTMPAILISEVTGFGPGVYIWAFDDKSLIYRGSDKKLHRFDTETKNSNLLITGDQGTATLLATSPKHPNDVAIEITNKSGRSVFLVDIESGTPRFLAKNPGFMLSLDQDLNVRIGWMADNSGCTSYKFNSNSSQWTVFKKSTYDEFCYADRAISFDASGEFVFWADMTTREYITVLKYNISDGSYVEIYKPKSTSFRSPPIHPTTGKPLAYFEERGKCHIVPSDEIRDDIEFLLSKKGDDVVGLPEADIVGLTPNLNMTKWIVHFSANGWPIRYILYDRENETLVRLFDERSALGKYRLSPVYPVEIKSRDGYNFICYMTYPLDVPPYGTKPPAAVIKVHGGPYTRDSYQYSEKAQLYANRGYVVFECNFRASIGYGKTWMRMSYGEWGRKCHYDIVDVVKWAVNEKLADPDRIAITGHSYGGYESLFAFTYSPDLWACAVAEAPRADLARVVTHWPRHWPRPDYDRKMGILNMSKNDAEKFLSSRSPLTYAFGISKPILILHGQQDSVINVSDPRRFVQKLQSGGSKVGFAVFLDEGHDVVKTENKLAEMAIIENFLNASLSGRAMPVGQTVENSNVQVRSWGWLDFLGKPPVPTTVTPSLATHLSCTIANLFLCLILSLVISST